jgi:sterol desaturase/sphingolipid hydroxylase (fatty acid hydroxylase superfamily)
VDIFDVKGLLIAFVIFVPLERVFPLHSGQRIFRRHFLNDVVYALLNGVVIRGMLVLIIAGAMATLGTLVPAGLKTAVGAQPTWLQVVQVIVMADLGFYWTHRAFHVVPALWRFHAIHHGIEELDWLAAHRVHPFDQAVTRAVSVIPVLVLGYEAAALTFFAVAYHFHGFLLHSNVQVPFGPLRWAVASPQFHHWHHANERAAYDRNFAGQLSFLDALFGTLHLPGSALPQRYGVDSPVAVNYISQLAFPFLRR